MVCPMFGLFPTFSVTGELRLHVLSILAPWLSPYKRVEGRPFTPACICTCYRTRVSPAWLRRPVIGEAGCQGRGGKVGEYKHQIWHGSKNLEKREEGSPKYQAPVSEGDLSLSTTRGIKTANRGQDNKAGRGSDLRHQRKDVQWEMPQEMDQTKWLEDREAK